MGMRFMEHILILTDDPDGTKDWWVENLGFTEGDHPDFGFPVHWLCIGDQDVIHIGQRNQSQHQSTYLATPTDEPDRTDPPMDAGAAPSTMSASTATGSSSSPPASTRKA